MMTDTLHVVHARAAGLDVHKMQITASVRLCAPGAGSPQVETRTFEALASGLDALVAWLREREVAAAVMEGTGIYWLAPFEALEKAGIPATLVNARQVKQLKGRKTDVADSVWLARVCQFGLATPSHVPPKAFRELRVLTRYRRTLISQRSRVRNRVQKVLDRSGCARRRRPVRCLRCQWAAHPRRAGSGARPRRHPRLAQRSRRAQARTPRRCAQIGSAAITRR